MNYDKIKGVYDEYAKMYNIGLYESKEYEIYNYTSKKVHRKYNIDVFEVVYEKTSYYFLKHDEDLYRLSPFGLNNIGHNFISHMAITDINNDGHIEILSALNSFKENSNYCSSYITVIDTKSKYDVLLYDFDNVNYFIEDENGVISIYNTNGILPKVEDLNEGLLDKKYIKLATNLYKTTVLNTAIYNFKEYHIDASCDLFEVSIDVDPRSIDFPYLYDTGYGETYFTLDITMKYLGETFTYTSGYSYRDGAEVTFVCGDTIIMREPFMAGTSVETYTITTGMEIKTQDRYHEVLNELNVVGTYDMVITYDNTKVNIKDTIVIEDFLTISR